MVKGLLHFKKYFEKYSQNYILIGGAASDILMEQAGLPFRTTKDLDIILVVEALNKEFVHHFWKYIHEGKYQNKQFAESNRKFYRFQKPNNEEFPVQIELFARKPDVLNIGENSKLTPIPTDESTSSLSAILMDSDYYKFTLKNSTVIDNIHIASTEVIICLKAKAFLDLRLQKNTGKNIDSRNIKKHRNDVIRIALLLSEENKMILPNSVKMDMIEFIKILRQESFDEKNLAKSFGLPYINITELINEIVIQFDLSI